MKANELMIGDWVVYNGDTEYSDPIRVEGMDIATDSLITSDREDVGFDGVWPIPLTSEILEKNGFVANKHVYPYPYYEYINEKGKLKVGFAFPQGNRTSYKEPWIYIDSENVFVEHLPCIYVHELQHALKLCGVEKEIIL